MDDKFLDSQCSKDFNFPRKIKKKKDDDMKLIILISFNVPCCHIAPHYINVAKTEEAFEN